MVSHQAGSLVGVWSYYKDTNRYLRVRGVKEIIRQKRMEAQRGHTNSHLDNTQHVLRY